MSELQVSLREARESKTRERVKDGAIGGSLVALLPIIYGLMQALGIIGPHVPPPPGIDPPAQSVPVEPEPAPVQDAEQP